MSPSALEGLTESLTKEMDPSWNIKAVIVELGGFRTEWGGTSLQTFPAPPAYTAPNHPAAQFRAAAFQGTTPALGDPAKAAKALITVADLPNPPLRVQFGTDSWAIVSAKARETLRNAEKHADLSHSTNVDGVDKDTVLEKFRMYMAQE